MTIANNTIMTFYDDMIVLFEAVDPGMRLHRLKRVRDAAKRSGTIFDMAQNDAIARNKNPQDPKFQKASNTAMYHLNREIHAKAILDKHGAKTKDAETYSRERRTVRKYKSLYKNRLKNEAVDPEDRNVRLGKLRKAQRNAAGASSMAKDPVSKDTYGRKSYRIRRIIDKHSVPKDAPSRYHLTRDSKFGRSYHREGKGGQDHKASMQKIALDTMRVRSKGTKVDREARTIRTFKVRKAGKRAAVASDLAKKAGNHDAATRLHMKSVRAKYIADVNGPAGTDAGKRDYKRNHRQSLRGLSRGNPKPAAKAVSNSMPPKKTSRTGKIADVQPKLKKNSPINKEVRTKRIHAILKKGDAHIKAYHDNMSGKTTPGAARSVDDKGNRLTAHDHRLTTQRTHAIAAKFTKYPHQRAKLNSAIRKLRKGQSTVGSTKDWRKLKYPLADKGFHGKRKPE